MDVVPFYRNWRENETTWQLKPNRTPAASRGVLAAARLSCSLVVSVDVSKLRWIDLTLFDPWLKINARSTVTCFWLRSYCCLPAMHEIIIISGKCFIIQQKITSKTLPWPWESRSSVRPSVRLSACLSKTLVDSLDCNHFGRNSSKIIYDWLVWDVRSL